MLCFDFTTENGGHTLVIALRTTIITKFQNLPNTAGVDAFAFDWSTENNWFVPPIHLVGRDVKHMLHCEANGTLVVPKWTSALF